jgi:hypothetical protein
MAFPDNTTIELAATTAAILFKPEGRRRSILGIGRRGCLSSRGSLSKTRVAERH